MFSKKKLFSRLSALILSTVILLVSLNINVYAANQAAVVMTYNGTVYTKMLYDAEVDMIKAGQITDGIRNIGEMCDNVSVLTGGADKVNKQAVMALVCSQIQAGITTINIDLTKYSTGAATSSGTAAATVPAATTDVTTASVLDPTAVTTPAAGSTTASSPEALPVYVPGPKPAAYSPAMINYYKKAVFIGDSLMVGFRNYATRTKTSYLNSTNFLCAGSYSLRNALNLGSNLHPTYKGKKRPVWESIDLMDVDRVFIMFGMNDISVVGTDKSCQNYVALINKIKEVKPGIEINIISMTNVLGGSEKKGLNNAAVREFNTKLAALCASNGWGFCNLAPQLVDKNGALAGVYCSDHFVHQTNKAYSEVWDPFFYAYAQSKGVK